MSKFDFMPLNEQQKKMEDPEVKHAIRVLQSKGITLDQIKKCFDYYERLKRKNSGDLPDIFYK
jgi:hypothetical protein